MPKNNVISFDSCFRLPNPNLRTYFGRVQKGQDQIYDTPFAKGESTEELLSEWDRVLVSISDKWPSLYEFEVDLAKKVGPMSVMLPLSDRMKDIESYYEGILSPSQPILHGAVSAVIKEWSRARGLHVRSDGKTMDLMKKSTNSGSPFFTKRRSVSRKTEMSTIEFWTDDMIKQIFFDSQNAEDIYNSCAVLGWRGQEGGPSPKDVKQRVVWMFPFAVNLHELQVYQPLIEAAQKFNLVPAWVSMEAVDMGITKLFDTKSTDDLIVCTDFTAFDQHFNDSLQEAALNIMQAVFTRNSDWDYWEFNVFPVKYTIPLAYDYGKLKTGRHGMGSGSGGTNADETLAHRALQYEAAMFKGKRLNPNSQCLGDDGILSYPGITVEDVVRAYSKHGLEMNHSKQYASTQDCIYLRRWHHKDYRLQGVCAGVYSTNRALGRLRYLERYQSPRYWDKEMVALRQLSIIENVKNHPLRDEFAEFCMKRDRYRLGIDIPGFMENLERKARKAIEVMPDFLGYTKTLQQGTNENIGIDSWWIVNYLKSR